MADTATPELGPSDTLADALAESAHQTAGPYWHLVDFPEWADTTRHFPNGNIPGELVVLTGRITDGAGAPVGDALVEIWHADPAGDYPSQDRLADGFHGYGRCATQPDGSFRFVTLKPGPVRLAGPAGTNAAQAPHVALSVFARGLMRHLSTRLYFDGETLNQHDPVLNAVPPARRHTLLARSEQPGTWILNLRLQGEDETVWMAI